MSVCGGVVSDSECLELDCGSGGGGVNGIDVMLFV